MLIQSKQKFETKLIIDALVYNGKHVYFLLKLLFSTEETFQPGTQFEEWNKEVKSQLNKGQSTVRHTFKNVTQTFSIYCLIMKGFSVIIPN